MSRVEELDKTVNAINDSKGLSVEEIMTVILTEIAGSLAVIADAMKEEKKGGSDGRNQT